MKNPSVTIRHREAYFLEYRCKTWACVCHYYGTPDFDEWGKSPEIT